MFRTFDKHARLVSLLGKQAGGDKISGDDSGNNFVWLLLININKIFAIWRRRIKTTQSESDAQFFLLLGIERECRFDECEWVGWRREMKLASPNRSETVDQASWGVGYCVTSVLWSSTESTLSHSALTFPFPRREWWVISPISPCLLLI